MKDAQSTLTIKLHCIDFPGRAFDGRANIKVGVQKGDSVIDDVFGDAASADFTFELRVERNKKSGKPNFLGPYAHGKPDERFLYLSWGERKGSAWVMFRRAKIHLRDLKWATVEKAVDANRALEAVVKLKDKKGEPLCASVKSDNISWQS